MIFKKVLAGVAASALVAAMCVTAFADTTLEASVDADLTYTVTADVDELSVTVTLTDYMLDTSDGISWNDWCGGAVIVTLSDGTVNYYDYGGAKVEWGVDLDGDEANDTEGYGSASWVGTVSFDDGGGTLTIPVEQGATVEFVVNSWTDQGYDDVVQYTLTIAEATETGDVSPVVYLAAVVALAGVALVASKKVHA